MAGIWHESVIDTILRNEKYQGDLLLGRSSTASITCGRSTRPNRGELPQYLVQDNHEGIVTREVFAEVQASIRARAAQFPSGYAQRVAHPFSGKLVLRALRQALSQATQQRKDRMAMFGPT